jgi:NosR/NirI family nitrous oxide reductase transcriptional regulator
MRHSGPIAVTLLCLLGVPSAAYSQQRFPPPEFEGDYRMPTTTTPGPEAPWAEYADLAVLVVALAAASVVAIRTRRRWMIVALSIFSMMYFGFYRGGCVCPIGAIQNVALALFGGGYAVPLVIVAFFVVPMAATLFFGRTFCAAVCPLGAVQDLIVVKPLLVPGWLEHSLGLLAWVYLAAAVVFAATNSAMLICRYDPFVSIFRMVPLGKMFEAWARGDPKLDPVALSGRLDTLLLAGVFVLIGLFIARPYCRYFCPYGVLLGLLSKVSRWRVTITPTECVQCRLCEDTCPVGAIREPTAEAAQRQRTRGKAALAAALAAAPLLTVAGAMLGGALGGTMARMHPTVALADRIRLENDGKVEGTTDESDGFRATGRPAEELYAEARGIEDTFVSTWGPAAMSVGAAHLFGGFVGLVIGLKLVGLSIRRKRTDYEADRASCVACGRCFAHCPVEQARRKGTEVVIPQQET